MYSDIKKVHSNCFKTQWRSSLHISPHNLRISKWSSSGKNGLKQQMLYISVAYNVISCKKNKKNTLEQPKSPILLCIFGSQVQKWAKIAWKTYSLIAICSILFYYFGPIERLILWCKNTKKRFIFLGPIQTLGLNKIFAYFLLSKKCLQDPCGTQLAELC